MCFGGTTTSVMNENPTVPEASPQENAAQAADLAYSTSLMPSATAASQQSANALAGIVAPNYQDIYNTGAANLATANQQLASAAAGNVPQSITDARTQVLNDMLGKTIGTTINNLGNNGVLNSSVTQNSLQKIGQDADTSINANYTTDLGLASNLAQQSAAAAAQPLALASAAQTAGTTGASNLQNLATQYEQPESDAWTKLMAARYSLKSTPTAVVQQNSNIGSGLLGAVGQVIAAGQGGA
jgi:hypothetical protein